MSSLYRHAHFDLLSRRFCYFLFWKWCVWVFFCIRGSWNRIRSVTLHPRLKTWGVQGTRGFFRYIGNKGVSEGFPEQTCSPSKHRKMHFIQRRFFDLYRTIFISSYLQSSPFSCHRVLFWSSVLFRFLPLCLWADCLHLPWWVSPVSRYLSSRD